MKRTVVTITFDKRTGGWRVRLRGRDCPGMPTGVLLCTQASVVTMLAGYLRINQRSGNIGQLVLHGKDGRIRWERTYGKDPRRTKG